MTAVSPPSRPARPDRPVSVVDADPPAVRIDITVRDDMLADVVISINGVQVIGGVDDEP